MEKQELSKAIREHEKTGMLSLVIFCGKTGNLLQRWNYVYGFPLRKTWCKFCEQDHEKQDLLYDFEFIPFM